VVATTTTLAQYLKLSAEGLSLLNRGVQYVEFAQPTDVVHKGQVVSGAYLVTEGQLRVFTYTPQGKEVTLYSIRAGETCVLAINCLFNDLLYPAWVEAASNTRVAVIPGATYRQLFESEAAIQDMTVRALSTLVFRLMGELEQLHACKLDQRLANFLLLQASSDGVVKMTQQAIASHLGTSREVVARLLRGLVAEGSVATGRGELRLLDSEMLGRRGQPAEPLL